MNLVLFTESELEAGIPSRDARVTHARRVLRLGFGEGFRAGIENGPLGTASFAEGLGDTVVIRFQPEGPSLPPAPLTLLLGFPRPIQAGRLFKDLASLGVGRIVLAQTELGEKSYVQSDFFRNGEWLFHLREGLMQAGTTILPEVERHWSLDSALASIASSVAGLPTKAALDNVRPEGRLADVPMPPGTVLAVGSERGWTDAEREKLVAAGFSLRSIGARILKTETAAVASCTLALSSMGEL